MSAMFGVTNTKGGAKEMSVTSIHMAQGCSVGVGAQDRAHTEHEMAQRSLDSLGDLWIGKAISQACA